MTKEELVQLKSELAPVKLMAVSKTKPLEDVLRVRAMGQTLFGENHVQEIVEKFSVSVEGAEVEMIGHLQSNKAKKAVALCSRIDSVDSLKLLGIINKEAAAIGKVQRILIELNTSGEEAKSGFTTEEEAFEAIAQLRNMANVKLEGFMTVGPVECTVGTPEWEEKTHASFRKLRLFAEKAKAMYPDEDLFELSMGMSADYKIAIQEGSTMVRIGTRIFGQRSYN